MDKVKIRKAQQKDLKSIIRIFRTEYAKPPYHEKWLEKWAEQRVAKDFKDCAYFVLDINHKVQGFLILGTHTWDIGKRGFIEEIVVSAPFQDKGYGKKLLLFAESWFKKKGAKAIALIASPHAKAFKFYKHFNYKEEGLVSMSKKIN